MIRRILLSLSFLLIAVGIFGLLSSLQEAPAPATATGTTAAGTSSAVEDTRVPVWQTRRSIKLGQPVTPDDLEIAAIAKSLAQEQGLTGKQPFPVKPGSLARANISVGAMITEAQLLAPGDEGYVDLLITPGMVPYPLQISGASDYQAVLVPGDRVDVVMIASLEQNIATDQRLDNYRGLSVHSLLQNRRVLAVEKPKAASGIPAGISNETVVIELSREDVSKVMIARRVGLLDIHKSTQEPLPEVKAGDVLTDFYSVTELRGEVRVVN